MAYQIRYDCPNPKNHPGRRLLAVCFLVILAALLIQNRIPIGQGLAALRAGKGWYEAALVWCRMTLGLSSG